jgi:hypothetical protein
MLGCVWFGNHEKWVGSIAVFRVGLDPFPIWFEGPSYPMFSVLLETL